MKIITKYSTFWRLNMQWNETQNKSELAGAILTRCNLSPTDLATVLLVYHSDNVHFIQQFFPLWLSKPSQFFCLLELENQDFPCQIKSLNAWIRYHRRFVMLDSSTKWNKQTNIKKFPVNVPHMSDLQIYRSIIKCPSTTSFVWLAITNQKNHNNKKFLPTAETLPDQKKIFFSYVCHATLCFASIISIFFRMNDSESSVGSFSYYFFYLFFWNICIQSYCRREKIIHSTYHKLPGFGNLPFIMCRQGEGLDSQLVPNFCMQ